MLDEEKHVFATHIVSGKVHKIFQRVEKLKEVGHENWEYTAQIELNKVFKPDLMDVTEEVDKQHIFVRYWTMKVGYCHFILCYLLESRLAGIQRICYADNRAMATVPLHVRHCGYTILSCV